MYIQYNAITINEVLTYLAKKPFEEVSKLVELLQEGKEVTDVAQPSVEFTGLREVDDS